MLFPSFRQSLQSLFEASRSKRIRQRHRSSLQSTKIYSAVEQLEDRTLLTANPGWAFLIGGEINDGTNDINIGPDGNVVVIGWFSRTVDFDPGPGTTNLTSSETFDGFVAKYTPDQQLIWARQFGGTDGFTPGRRIDSDAAGNIYIHGSSDASSMDFGPFTLTNQTEGRVSYLAKLDSAGTFQWAHLGTGAASMAVGDSGNVYLSGQFKDTRDFDPGPGIFNLTSQGDKDGYLQYLDTNGDFIAAMSIGGPEYEKVRKVTLDGTGNVYISGDFHGTAQFGTIDGSDPDFLTSGGESDTFLMKIDANGSTQWIRQATSTSGISNGGVGFDGFGGVYFAGNFSEDINFVGTGTSLTSQGIKNNYISKWDADGNLIWSNQFSGTGSLSITQNRFDTDGAPYFAGWFGQTAEFDPGSDIVELTSKMRTDLFLLKLDTNGNFQWVKQVERQFFGEPGISISDGGDVYMTSLVGGEPTTLPTGEVFTHPNELHDGFVLKLEKLGLDNSSTTYNSTDVPKALKDAKGKSSGKTNSTLAITDSFEILDVNVELDISHARVEDLDVFLISPNGTRVELFSDIGGSGSNFAGTTLDDQAFEAISSGAAPFTTGRFHPEGLLSDFNGEFTDGTWILEIEDDTKFVAGTLYSWSITFTHPIPAPPSPGITVTPTSGLVTTEAGGSDSFNVVLDAAPSVDVTIGISSSDTTEGTVSTASLIFRIADWATPQIVTVTGVDDLIEDGNIAYTIVTAPATGAAEYAGLDAADVSVTNQDDEVPADPPGITVTPTSGLVTTEKNAGTDSFTVVLNTQPTADVTIGISSSDTTEGTVSSASLTFTPFDWNVLQIVTITGVDDNIRDGNIAYTIITAAAASVDTNYDGRDVSDVSVTNNDDEKGKPPKLMAETTGDGTGIIPLSQADAEAFAEIALQLWIGAEGISAIPTFDVIVADLPGNQLGMFDGNTITLDVDAAGVGWFVDTTPFDNSEFAFGVAGYDLLTAAAHEVGHALGFDHDHNGVMEEILAVGERHLPGENHLSEALVIPMFDANTQNESTSYDSLGSGGLVSPQPLAEKSSYALENDFDSPLTDDDFSSSEPIPYLPEEDLDADSFFSEFSDSLLDDLLAIL